MELASVGPADLLSMYVFSIMSAFCLPPKLQPCESHPIAFSSYAMPLPFLPPESAPNPSQILPISLPYPSHILPSALMIIFRMPPLFQKSLQSSPAYTKQYEPSQAVVLHCSRSGSKTQKRRLALWGNICPPVWHTKDARRCSLRGRPFSACFQGFELPFSTAIWVYSCVHDTLADRCA